MCRRNTVPVCLERVKPLRLIGPGCKKTKIITLANLLLGCLKGLGLPPLASKLLLVKHYKIVCVCLCINTYVHINVFPS